MPAHGIFGHLIDDAYQSVDKHLEGSVVFTLMHNGANIYDRQHAKSQITNPVKLVKHHRKGVHDILRAIPCNSSHG